MPLHPEIARILATLPHEDGPLDPVAMRAGEEAQVPPLADRHPVREVVDTVAHTAVSDVPIRVYADTDADASGVIVYFHGGAWFLGSLNTHDHIARQLATATGLRVISVGYRLAPENAFPAALEDGQAVVGWVIAQGEDAGWDGSTLALAGDSSGGTMVAAIAATLHDAGVDAVTHQVMFYPSVDLDLDPGRYPSMTENAVGYGLETAGIAPFNAFYMQTADPQDPRVSPVKREDLTGLPPALVLTGEFDPMRDEGELYARRLEEAGVPVTLTRYLGAGHGFVQHFSWLPEYGRAFTQTAEFLGR
ncbi:MAG: alpha/beta hydrolase [Microbacterium sp.]|uniref:alpha/beta hydrolase n=1 Tax=Microbacterium sp. TaxID=51671 RepID=UPI00263631E8|nr:alpha/beta hydrolase [Microbacterium sp.]MCX6501779.1 alpha/beta hydrolase [Microbacterium sp.]